MEEQNPVSHSWAHQSVDQIPLPNQLPPKVQIDLRTTTVPAALEALQSQNEDLLARLGIQLRRNLDLEVRNRELLERSERATAQYLGKADETRLIQDKMIRTEEKLASDGERLTRLQDEISYLRPKAEKFLETSNVLAEMESSYAELRRDFEFQIQVIHTLQDDLKQSQSESQEALSAGALLSKKLDELAKRYKSDIASLMEQHEQHGRSFETERSNLEHASEKLRSEKAELAEKVAQFREAQIVLENRTIYAERRRDEIEKKFLVELETLQNQILLIRADSSSKAVQLQTVSEALGQTETRLHESETQRLKIKSQLDAVTMLYEQTARDREQFEKRADSNNRLNQHLSDSIAELRTKNEILEREVQTAKEQLQTHMKNLGHSIVNAERPKTAGYAVSEALISERGDLGDLLEDSAI